MRILAISAIATVVVLAQAASAQTPQPSSTNSGAGGSPTARTITRTGETKPPGSPVPEGPNRIDELQKKSDRIGRQAEQSICKC